MYKSFTIFEEGVNVFSILDFEEKRSSTWILHMYRGYMRYERDAFYKTFGLRHHLSFSGDSTYKQIMLSLINSYNVYNWERHS